MEHEDEVDHLRAALIEAQIWASLGVRRNGLHWRHLAEELRDAKERAQGRDHEFTKIWDGE